MTLMPVLPSPRAMGWANEKHRAVVSATTTPNPTSVASCQNVAAFSAKITTVDMVAGPVSKGMVKGTTAMLARAAATCSSSSLDLASAGCALSMARAEVISSMPPPT